MRRHWSASLIAIPQMSVREQHALLFAIAASLALHAAVVLLAPGVKPKKYVPELPTLTAVLRGPPQLEAPAPSAQPQPEIQPPNPPRPTPESKPKRETVKPKVQTPPVMTAPPAQPAPSVPASVSAAPESKPGPTAPAGPAATAPTTVAAAAPSAAAAHAETIDREAAQRYVVQVGATAVKYQGLPRAALENGWDGISEVKLTIGENGRIREAIVSNSSGHDVLDQRAIDIVRKTAPLIEITGGLRNREFTVYVPIRFILPNKGG
jgi:periplasmic protein TonB